MPRYSSPAAAAAESAAVAAVAAAAVCTCLPEDPAEEGVRERREKGEGFQRRNGNV